MTVLCIFGRGIHLHQTVQQKHVILLYKHSTHFLHTASLRRIARASDSHCHVPTSNAASSSRWSANVPTCGTVMAKYPGFPNAALASWCILRLLKFSLSSSTPPGLSTAIVALTRGSSNESAYAISVPTTTSYPRSDAMLAMCSPSSQSNARTSILPHCVLPLAAAASVKRRTFSSRSGRALATSVSVTSSATSAASAIPGRPAHPAPSSSARIPVGWLRRRFAAALANRGILHISSPWLCSACSMIKSASGSDDGQRTRVMSRRILGELREELESPPSTSTS
mmetsp:Transcript_5429/g.13672  ORF Transcript_5429/g.13672 Transcript_5429/m.13672 type:complete len:283 (+) Transcript_5429:82-930(+)